MPEEKKRPAGTTAPHQILLTEREQMKVEGVVNVDSFSDSEVTLQTTGGVLVVKGESLHIQQLSLDEGRLLLTGTVSSMAYADESALHKGKGFLARMFK